MKEPGGFMTQYENDFLQYVTDTFAECAKLIQKKNTDYAGNGDPYENFHRAADFAGVSVEESILVRLGDKLARLKNLLTRNGERAVLNESIEDTLLDIINYFVILRVWLKYETQLQTDILNQEAAGPKEEDKIAKGIKKLFNL
jgi:hypothetical protein